MTNTAHKTVDKRERKSAPSRIAEIIGTQTAMSSLLLAPFLKAVSVQNTDRWMIFVNPPQVLDKNVLQKMGVDPTCVLVLHCNTDKDALQLTQRALASGKGHTIVSWLNKAKTYPVSALELAAQKGNSQGLVIRQRI